MRVTINLLPSEKKEALKTKQLGRRIIRISFKFYWAMLIFALFLFGCLQIINVQKGTINDSVSKLNTNRIYRQTKDQQSFIKDYYQRSVNIEKSLSSQIFYTNVFEEINKIVPLGIDFSLVMVENKKIIIKGEGENRDKVIQFRDNLIQSKLFAKVDFPISNFTQEKSAPFEFNIELK